MLIAESSWLIKVWSNGAVLNDLYALRWFFGIKRNQWQIYENRWKQPRPYESTCKVLENTLQFIDTFINANTNLYKFNFNLSKPMKIPWSPEDVLEKTMIFEVYKESDEHRRTCCEQFIKLTIMNDLFLKSSRSYTHRRKHKHILWTLMKT